MKVEHHLITISLDDGRDLHGYLMANGKQALMHLTDYMFDLGNPRLPIVMQTLLDGEAVAIVREIICSLNEGNRKKLEESKDKNYLAVVFDAPVDHPDNRKLLDLH